MPEAISGGTFLTGGGIAFTAAAVVMILALPRHWALLSILLLICFMTMGQRIVLAGSHFTMLRVLVLFGLARALIRQEYRGLRITAVDCIIPWWLLSSILTYTLLCSYGPSIVKSFDGNPIKPAATAAQAFVNRCGLAYDVLTTYFLSRCLIRTPEDMRRIFRLMALCVVPLAGLMAVERITGHNPFSALGGIPAITIGRNGTIRCQGPFAHPVLAGTFGATLLPFFAGLWWQGGGNRRWSVFGILGAGVIVALAASSGPVVALIAGILGLTMWRWRRHLPLLLGCLLAGTVLLHLFMHAPVWFLAARANVFSGSDGWHRAYLIDRAVAHFPDWWLIGTLDNPAWGNELNDLTNEYVRVAVDGGLITLLLFLTVMARCFKGIGRVVRAGDRRVRALAALGSSTTPEKARLAILTIRRRQKLAWALGTSLLVHAVAYLSVSYFDQNFINWYLLLGMISTSMAAGVASQPERSHALPIHAVDLRSFRPTNSSTVLPCIVAPGGLRPE